MLATYIYFVRWKLSTKPCKLCQGYDPNPEIYRTYPVPELTCKDDPNHCSFEALNILAGLGFRPALECPKRACLPLELTQEISSIGNFKSCVFFILKMSNLDEENRLRWLRWCAAPKLTSHLCVHCWIRTLRRFKVLAIPQVHCHIPGRTYCSNTSSKCDTQIWNHPAMHRQAISKSQVTKHFGICIAQLGDHCQQSIRQDGDT